MALDVRIRCLPFRPPLQVLHEVLGVGHEILVEPQQPVAQDWDVLALTHALKRRARLLVPMRRPFRTEFPGKSGLPMTNSRSTTVSRVIMIPPEVVYRAYL